MKVEELRKKTPEELTKELLDLRKEQFNLRMQRGVGQATRVHHFNLNRKNIARVKTIMNEKILFKFLKKQPKTVLLDLLESAFHEMKTNQKNVVFGYMMDQVEPSKIYGKQIIKDVKQFYKDSLD